MENFSPIEIDCALFLSRLRFEEFLMKSNDLDLRNCKTFRNVETIQPRTMLTRSISTRSNTYSYNKTEINNQFRLDGNLKLRAIRKPTHSRTRGACSYHRSKHAKCPVSCKNKPKNLEENNYQKS